MKLFSLLLFLTPLFAFAGLSVPGGGTPNKIIGPGGAQISVADGNASITPSSGGSVIVQSGTTYVPSILDFSTDVSGVVSGAGHISLRNNGTTLLASVNGGAYASLGVGNVDASGNVTVVAGGANGSIKLDTTGTGGVILTSIKNGGAIGFGPNGGSSSYFTLSYNSFEPTSNPGLNGASLGTSSVYWGTAFISQINIGSTITVSGITGARTINKGAGTVNFAAAGATTITVTNSLVSATTQIILTRQKNDVTATAISVNNKVSGAFDIVTNSAATTELPVYWEIRNQ